MRITNKNPTQINKRGKIIAVGVGYGIWRVKYSHYPYAVVNFSANDLVPITANNINLQYQNNPMARGVGGVGAHGQQQGIQMQPMGYRGVGNTRPPTGWVLVKNPNGHDYYSNTTTGKSVWTLAECR